MNWTIYRYSVIQDDPRDVDPVALVNSDSTISINTPIISATSLTTLASAQENSEFQPTHVIAFDTAEGREEVGAHEEDKENDGINPFIRRASDPVTPTTAKKMYLQREKSIRDHSIWRR